MKTMARILAAAGLLCTLCVVSELVWAAAALTEKEALLRMVRHRQGIVYSMDFAARTAIISGYKYSFGQAGSGYNADVKMYNSNFGSFELLKPGMKVDVNYREFEYIRVVVNLRQLADNAVIKEI